MTRRTDTSWLTDTALETSPEARAERVRVALRRVLGEVRPDLMRVTSTDGQLAVVDMLMRDLELARAMLDEEPPAHVIAAHHLARVYYSLPIALLAAIDSANLAVAEAQRAEEEAREATPPHDEEATHEAE